MNPPCQGWRGDWQSGPCPGYEHADMTGSRPAAALDPPDELVRRAAHGDVAAFARLVRIHNESMTQVAFAVVSDCDGAMLATEAAWLQAWSSLGPRRSAEGLEAWLASLVAAQAVRVARHDRGDGPDARPRADRRVDSHAVDHPADGPLEMALARLHPDDRALLALCYVARLSTVGSMTVRWRSGPPRLRLARLTAKLAGVLEPGVSPEAAEELVAQRLRAYARIPDHPVDADAVARRARAEAALERTRVVSVAIAGVVGVLVAFHPYLAQLAFGR